MTEEAKPPAAAGRRNAQWPNADEQPEMQTLKAQFLRRICLFTIYFAWVCMLLTFMALWLVSGLMLLRALLAWDAALVPRSVRWYLLGMTLYGSYYKLTPSDHTWTFARTLARETMHKYPYFRYNSCVFEEDADNSKDTPPRLVAEDERAMFGFHPHGILSCGFSVNGVHGLRFARANMKFLVADNLFWFPVIRDLLLWLNCDNVNKKTFMQLMRAGRNIGFIPGGFEEATLYQRGRYRIFIKKRFGFIKLALQHGYKIYPGFTFGEEQTYHAFPYLQQLRLKLNDWKVPGAAFFGSKYCPIMPRSSVDIITVFGRALELPTIAHPTPEQVTTYQQLYVDALQGVFDRNKATYGMNPDATLEIL